MHAATPKFHRFGRRTILPGFRLTLGFTLLYISLLVLIPMAALVGKVFTAPWADTWSVISSDRSIASYQLSFGASAIAALVNGFFGFIIAWILVRYDFPGRRFADAVVDLPFALPTAVAGLSLTLLYSKKGLFGYYIYQMIGPERWNAGWATANSNIGVTIALTFIGLPFVVRTLQPVLQDLSMDVEEAAACLGANRWQTFWRIIFPAVLPAWLTGMTLAFGRAVGEYGSVVFIASNRQGKGEITPLVIYTTLEENRYAEAAALGVVLLLFSFCILALVNLLQAWNNKVTGASGI
ncbi:MAG: sulfate ABC transporter permease subunit CysT [Candidatus Methylacidiphilales bacterium]|nr:sulfate ABC transporter permease subunit CysT [Candidatus Methylacidiphilales bacterium]